MLFNKLLYKLYYGKIHQTGFHRKIPWIHVDIVIVIKTISKGLLIDFVPNGSCSAKDIAQLKKGKTSEARQKIYEQLPFNTTLFHEGVRFGLHYAFDIFKNETGFSKGLYVKVLKLNRIISSQNEEFAYIAANIFWQALDFTPKNKAFFDETTHKFVFPNTNKLVPIGGFTRNDIIKKYQQLGYDDVDEALQKYDAKFNTYHNLKR